MNERKKHKKVIDTNTKKNGRNQNLKHVEKDRHNCFEECI